MCGLMMMEKGIAKEAHLMYDGNEDERREQTKDKNHEGHTYGADSKGVWDDCSLLLNEGGKGSLWVL